MINSIRPTTPHLPPKKDTEFVPLIQKISFDPRVERAMLQVFGQTLLCRNREVCAQYAREHMLDCITLDGDQVNRRGALDGGYFDQGTSRLKAYNLSKEARTARTQIDREWQAIKSELEKADHAIRDARTSVENMRAAKTKLKNAVVELKKERARVNRRLKVDRERLANDAETDQLASDSVALDELKARVDALRAEQGSALVSKLSSTQQKELKQAEKSLPKLVDAQAKAMRALEKVSSKKRELEALLHNNLELRLDELQQQLEGGGADADASSQGTPRGGGMLSGERGNQLASTEEALARAVAATATAEEIMESGREELDELRQHFHKVEARCEESRSQLARLSERRQMQEKNYERVSRAV
tara:strand:+ start:79 stop:1164 length:1086 start_codon:yes stop_codon:yes gene_type:complete